MSAIGELPTFADADGTIHVVVETPRGSRAKYKFEPRLGLFTLHKALALGFSYPFAFGFVAGTKAEDGDPLDVLLVTTLDPPMGTVVIARPVGVIEIEQRDGEASPVRNDRLLAVPALAHDDRQPRKLGDIGERELADIEAFFIESGERDGKQVKIIARHGAKHAFALVERHSGSGPRGDNGDSNTAAAEVAEIKEKLAKTARAAGP
jgi:inorganic pyrophosphatase